MIGMKATACIQKLISKIETHEAKIAIMGLGYVGLPLLTAFF